MQQQPLKQDEEERDIPFPRKKLPTGLPRVIMGRSEERARFFYYFTKTKFPKKVILGPGGEDMVLPYHLYYNKVSLNDSYVEIVTHCIPCSHKDHPEYWFIIFKTVNGDIEVMNSIKARSVDPTRVAWYANAHGLSRFYKVWYWAATESAFPLPPVHPTVLQMDVLREGVREREDELKSDPEVIDITEI